MRVLCLTLVILLYLQVTLAREEWRDPHDMNAGPRYSNQHRSTSDEDLNNKIHKQNSSYLRRVLGIIISMTRFDRVSDIYKGQINIQLSPEDYDFLRDFTSGKKIDESALRKLDNVLNYSLQKSIFDTAIFTFGEYIYHSLWNGNTILAISLMVTAFILWKMEPHNYSFKSLFKLFLPLVYISDFVLRFRAMIEEAEIDKYLEHKKHSKCDTRNLGWFDWFSSFFIGDFCEKNERNYLLSQRSAYLIMTPMKVITQQFNIIVPILGSIGSGCGQFMWALINDVPWYVKPFVAPLAFILVIILILMCGTYALGISPRLNILYILQLEFLNSEHHNRKREDQGDRLTGRNLTLALERGLNRSPESPPVIMMPGNSSGITTSKRINSTKSKTKKKSYKVSKEFLLQIKNENQASIPCSLQDSWEDMSPHEEDDNEEPTDKFQTNDQNHDGLISEPNIDEEIKVNRTEDRNTTNLLIGFHEGSKIVSTQIKNKNQAFLPCSLKDPWEDMSAHEEEDNEEPAEEFQTNDQNHDGLISEPNIDEEIKVNRTEDLNTTNLLIGFHEGSKIVSTQIKNKNQAFLPCSLKDPWEDMSAHEEEDNEEPAEEFQTNDQNHDGLISEPNIDEEIKVNRTEDRITTNLLIGFHEGSKIVSTQIKNKNQAFLPCSLKDPWEDMSAHEEEDNEEPAEEFQTNDRNHDGLISEPNIDEEIKVNRTEDRITTNLLIGFHEGSKIVSTQIKNKNQAFLPCSLQDSWEDMSPHEEEDNEEPAEEFQTNDQNHDGLISEANIDEEIKVNETTNLLSGFNITNKFPLEID